MASPPSPPSSPSPPSPPSTLASEEALPALTREACVYTSCYCEENVYQLAASLVASGRAEAARLHAVFISNVDKTVAVWRQKAGGKPDGAVVWDYHVILVHKREDGESEVYDLDTTVPGLPSPFATYFSESFRPHAKTAPRYLQAFRVVPAETYLKTFSSDRSHMRDKRGAWLATPPTYPPIQAAGVATNLGEFMSMVPGSHPDKGSVMSLKELGAFFGTRNE